MQQTSRIFTSTLISSWSFGVLFQAVLFWRESCPFLTFGGRPPPPQNGLSKSKGCFQGQNKCNNRIPKVTKSARAMGFVEVFIKANVPKAQQAFFKIRRKICTKMKPGLVVCHVCSSTQLFYLVFCAGPPLVFAQALTLAAADSPFFTLGDV